MIDNVSVKVRGVIRLTRWREYVPFVIPLTIFGALIATHTRTESYFDWRLGVVTIANILAVAYGFMINDIEDAPDDAREAHRAARNPVASGEITPLQGWVASGGVALVTLGLYALAGIWPFIIGLLTVALCHLYSWRPVRLKAWPVTDIVSHSLMLSGLLFLSGYFTYDTNPGLVWFVAAAATLISVYGQLYNQIRDYDMDRAAGLNNTVIMVGKNNARYLMYSSVAMAGLLMLYAFYVHVVPLWILAVPLVVAPILIFTRGPVRDMRGGEAVDPTGGVQVQMVAVANVTIAIWLAVTMLGKG